MTKQDEILNHVIVIKTDMAMVKQHLLNLNGNVARHEKNINKNEDCIGRLSRKQAYYAGGLSVFIVIVGLLIKFL